MIDFFIIGAAKSGTTSLFYQARDHPQIFCPAIKELNYFSKGQRGVTPGSGPGDERATTWVSSLEEYKSYFEGSAEGQITGEASVSYLYSPISADRIHEHVPDTKIIAVLRDPVERAWSNYCHMVRDGRETLDFKEALKAEEERRENGWEFSWHYKRLGLYGNQLERYLYRFPEYQIKVFRFRDLKSNTGTIVKKLFSFLGVDPSYEPKVERRHNQSGKVRSNLVARFVNRPNLVTRLARKIVPLEVGHRIMEVLRQLNMEKKPPIPDEAEEYLQEYYSEDVKRTEQLTGLDLSHWKPHA